MGFYTVIKGELTIKNEYYKSIEILLDLVRFRVVNSPWEHMAVDQRFVELIDDDRSSFIPFGNGIEHTAPSFIDGIFKFHCSLKNYEQTVEKFFKIVPIIAYVGTIDTTNEHDRFLNSGNGVWRHYKLLNSIILDLGYDPEIEVDGFNF